VSGPDRERAAWLREQVAVLNAHRAELTTLEAEIARSERVYPPVFIIVGRDGSVRGFPFTRREWADESLVEANAMYPDASPHEVVPYAPKEST